jgi:hypothetical protein
MFKLLIHIVISGFIIMFMTGVTINFHFCQEGLYDVALNSQAHDCCDGEEHDHHCHPPADQDHSDRCKDKTVKMGTTDDYIVSSCQNVFSDLEIIELFTESATVIENRYIAETHPGKLFHFKKPPTFPEVTLSRVQSFLI